MAKIEKIRLGGMCRLPSSRLVADGMASESLNLVTELEETAPVLPPSLLEGDDIPESWRAGNGEMVFVHTRPSYESHIYLVGQGIGTWAVDDEGEWEFTAFMEMAEGETLNGIVGIGNTLVVSTSEATHYVLWKDGSYRDLGTELPRPAVRFYSNENNPPSDGVWPAAWSRRSENVDDDATEEEIVRKIWEVYADLVATIKNDISDISVYSPAFYQPYLFRYALRLYDGTYARQSVPVLVGAGQKYPMAIGVYYDNGSGDGLTVFAYLGLFNVRAEMDGQVSQDWSDIVTSVDIFCSSPVSPVDVGDGSIRRLAAVTDVPYLIGKNFYPYCELDIPEERLLNCNVFYRIGSFLIDNSAPSYDPDYDPAQEFTANQEDLDGGYGIGLRSPDPDTLVTHTSTASTDWDDYGTDHTYRGGCQKVMNQRLAIWDITQTLGTGLPVLNSSSWAASETENETVSWDGADVCEFEILWLVESDGVTGSVLGRYLSDGTVFSPFGRDLSLVGETPLQVRPLEVYGWLAYPDAKCKRAVFHWRRVYRCQWLDGEWQTETDDKWSDASVLPMKEHPFLNCAYAWLGFGRPLREAGSPADPGEAEMLESLSEDREVHADNRIMLSGVSDPFTFPASGYYDFDYAVISCATANMPLSTGQFGQFPLYVFTKGGIWAMAMNADGTFASSSPFSRDVALSDKGVCEIDQGIVFIAEKAVLAIQGGQITDISQLMGGRHDTLPDSAVDALGGSGYGKDGVTVGDLSPAWTDAEAFMAFMADAEAGYDYKGDRMVFINGAFDWQWVWMRKSSTWHRTMLHGGDYGMPEEGAVRVVSFVNSWPGLAANLATAGEEPLRAVGEMTSQLDRTRGDDLSATGLYVSRPLSFGEQDVFKSVTDLRLRGDLRRGNARHLLLSSNNGRDWVLRKSLRGPSFRFHRIVVATRMTTAERLSYIETQFEERFANRLR